MRFTHNTAAFMLFAASLTAPLATASAASTSGEALYNANCSVCHQAAGAGAVGQFPPLKGRVDKIAAASGGKTYLADVVLNGLHGTITAAGSSYSGFMPALKSLSDDDLAAILTYTVHLGNPAAPAITPQDIAAERGVHKKAKEILAERATLEAAHAVP